MGLMECPAGHGQLITTPHPVTLEGQTNIAAELIPGETLGAFLRRSVPDWTGDAWEVRINGVLMPVEVMDRVRPKDGTVIEVRGVVRKQALYIVAMIALTYFTMGAGAAWAGALGATGMAATAVYAAAFVAGSILINKVLGPKPASSGGQAQQQTVYNIGAGRNQARQYQPLPLVFGTVKFAPDIVSAPYNWYEGDDQYLGMVLTPGINAHSFEPLFNGDALLSSFQGVQVFQSGFPALAQQQIPLYSNADTITGGELNKNQTWVQRTTPAGTVRVQINLEYILGDMTSKQKPYLNVETVESQFRPVGTTNWLPLISRDFANSSYDPKRATLSRDVAEGQYDVRVRIRGRAVDGGGSNGRSQWNWTTMTAVQADTATYAGIPRIGVRIKATGQLNGAPDELRCVVHSRPIPVWKGPGTGWVTEETSNPGAQILQYSRGITDEKGHRIGGIGLTDDMIDIAALQAFMLHCAANSFEYNYVVKDARSHDEMVNSLAAAGFGQVTWAGGRLSVVWAAVDQPLSGVVNMATIKKGEFQVDYTLANAADGVEVTYFDVEAWETRTIRIPAPGVTTMLNPAQIALEGVGHEWHAAMLGRWHLAQSLYQYKDISFATDIEHLSYQRLSLLSLSHDLTQWGFSGRLRGASIVGGVVSLALDEPVRAPPAGSAYIGLRIPGERTYRVFGVQAFTGESNSLTLTSAWPNDAPLPGDTAGNPAHDTLWCYDFKATPGYRVRVVAIEPESDLKGARVAVVPESPEFWHYVLTGEYIPAPNESLLQTRPIASNLGISERQVVQGDTVFTELVASFEITGPVGDVVVQMSNENGELEEVARTTTRTAAWRIPGAGTYQVVVRPFSPDGQPGVAVATIYSTIGADAPPVLVDLFDVEERSGGVRLYTWGWLTGTTQSADFAGVEIRYVAGNVPAPEWEAMTPVGEDGYHTAPFEAVIPESGQWTFAARSRNTSGTLSTGMRVLTKTLGKNLGEQIGGIGESLDEITQRQVEEQARLDQAIYDSAQAALANASAIAAESLARAQALADEALVRADGDAALADAVLQEATNRGTAITNLQTIMQSADESLAQEIAQISAGTGEQFDPARIWYFDTDLEAWSGNGTPTVVDGWLRPANHASAPYVQSPDNLGIDGSAYRFAKLRIRRVGAPAWRGAVQWTTTTDNVFNTAKQATIPEPTFDANGVATIDFRDIAWWPATVRRVRLLVSTAQTAASYFLIDWIAIGRPTPGAGVAALQEERTARIAGDSAEATQRNTLAAQLRGAYEGTDVAGVATGLMYSERTARATADAANLGALSAEVTARETLQAQVTDATTGLPATRARLIAEETARADADTGLSQRITVTEAAVAAPNFAAVKSWQFVNASPGYNGFSVANASLSSFVAPSNFGATAVTATANDPNFVTPIFEIDGKTANVVRALVRRRSGDSAWDGRLFWATPSHTFQMANSAVSDKTPSRGGGASDWTMIEWNLSTDADWNSSTITRLRFDFDGGAASIVDVRSISIGIKDGTLASSASVAAVEQASTSADLAQSIRTGLIEARMSDSTGQLASAASVLAASQAAATATGAVAQDLASVSVQVNGQSASITNLSEVSASATSGNAILDPSFESPAAGMWSFSSASISLGINNPRTGANCLTMFGSATPGHARNSGAMTPVKVGDTIPLQFWVRRGSAVPNGYCRINVRWFRSNKTEISYVGTNCSTTSATTSWALVPGSITVPAEAAYAQFEMATTNTVTTAAYVVDDVEAVMPNSVTTAARAKNTVVLDVNGNVSGTVNENDGTRSVFSIIASVFRVISSGSAGLDWENGHLRAYFAGAQLLLGSNFGTGDLMMWAGPNVGAANCTKANGLFWLDSVGTGYFAGEVLQGVLRAFESNTTVSTTATVSTGTINTKTKAVAVQGRFNYSAVQAYNGATSNITLGTGSTRATVLLERRYRNADDTAWESFVTLAEQPLMGGVEVTNLSDGPSVIQWSINGQISATDAASVRKREYRTRVVSLSRQAHSVTNPGTTPAMVQNQYQSIESME
ncbi:host specificity factor TipJ family phage tail protein [Luteimonas terrae]|uniref:Tip attachment protein J domain-containing protein n=1 Tax=Luteimonas terrae TaxID=1530191 RepID=A0ABU1XXC3_9GAMM|nr:host specificity factor TipJ family phage tail protein [Luteimonas terrae]MDR7193358.1 hypothetical protein [Luteimonas terrae]